MSTTTAVLLFILVGHSLQQDAITSEQCNLLTQSRNDYCLSGTGFSRVDVEDLTEFSFCSNALALTQCLDASCLSYSVREAVNLVVPGVNRPHVCPICYDQPAIVYKTRQTCTVWGQNHVVPFNRRPETCNIASNFTFTIISTPYFNLTAESNVPSTGDIRINAVRFDYRACAVFSKTWRKSLGWKTETLPTQGWFPHTIQITQNSTHVFIELPALNTEIMISASAPSMAVSVSTGILSLTSTGVCMSNYCTLDSVLATSTPLAPCTAYPPEFSAACWADLLVAVPVTLSVPNAVAIDADMLSRTNTSTLEEVEFQKTGLPLVLTLGPTAIMVAIFIGGFYWRRKAIKHAAETMSFAAEENGCCSTGTCCCCCFNNGGADMSRHVHRNLERAPIRAIWCWIVFCLNPHVLGMVFPFTGMTLVSAFCGIWILAWVGSNHKCIHFGSSKFTVQSIHITKAFLGFALPQQLGIGIIGAAATEYYLIEVQFWWGLAVLFLMLTGGIFMCFLCLDMSWAAKILNGSVPARQEQPMQALHDMVAALEANRVEQQPPQPIMQQHVVQVQQLPPPMRVEALPQAQPIMMQQGPVVPPPQAHVMMQPLPQEHVMQPQQGPVLPPPQMQEHVMQPQQPRPQSHVIEPQPIFYGNPSDAPPPPMSGGAFNAPSPIDVYQNPAKYMAAPDAFMGSNMPSNNSDTARQVAKRAIKIAGIEVDPVREGLICGKMQELLQSYNLTGSLYGEDSRAAGLRNDLAKNLAEELKMYRNDSIEDLAFGLKEAVLLWKDEHQL